MAKKHTPKALVAAIGATFIASMAASPIVSADQNPFSMTPLSSGYQVADSHGGGDKMKKGMDGKCGEGKCGGKMKKEMDGKCGEGKCGSMKKDGKMKGKMKGKKEGSCGEGKCGGKK